MLIDCFARYSLRLDQKGDHPPVTTVLLQIMAPKGKIPRAVGGRHADLTSVCCTHVLAILHEGGTYAKACRLRCRLVNGRYISGAAPLQLTVFPPPLQRLAIRCGNGCKACANYFDCKKCSVGLILKTSSWNPYCGGRPQTYSTGGAVAACVRYASCMVIKPPFRLGLSPLLQPAVEWDHCMVSICFQ